MLTWRPSYIYTDNFYTSPALFTELKGLGFRACGTVRVDRRGMPKQFRNKSDMERGEVRKVELSKELTALQWQDKRLVTMLSTIHNDDMISKRQQTRHAAGGREEIQKPVMDIIHIWVEWTRAISYFLIMVQSSDNKMNFFSPGRPGYC